jgi:hypothetical protein
MSFLIYVSGAPGNQNSNEFLLMMEINYYPIIKTYGGYWIKSQVPLR